VCALGEFVGLISARVCLGWAWVRVGEGFGERITTGARCLVRE
jgi:hypothetical protein